VVIAAFFFRELDSNFAGEHIATSQCQSLYQFAQHQAAKKIFDCFHLFSLLLPNIP
jgi:hypothetical protein